MTWTYSGDPETSLKDYVRFLVGDTDEMYSYLTDEEIAFLLKKSLDNPKKAALAAVDGIIARLSKEVDYTIGPESVKANQRLTAYRRLRGTLFKDGLTSAAPTWADPLMHSAHPVVFDIGMHDNGGDPGGSTN